MIEITPLGIADAEAVIPLYEQNIDGGKYVRDTVYESFMDETFIGYQAKVNGKLVGFFTGSCLLEFTVPHPELEEEIRSITGEQEIFVACSMLVLPEYRHLGIATQFCQRIREDLKAKGIPFFMAEIWIFPDGTIPSRKVYEDIGEIVYQKRVDGFYTEGYRYGVVCSVCGKHCKCGALVTLMKVC